MESTWRTNDVVFERKDIIYGGRVVDKYHNANGTYYLVEINGMLKGGIEGLGDWTELNQSIPVRECYTQLTHVPVEKVIGYIYARS